MRWKAGLRRLTRAEPRAEPHPATRSVSPCPCWAGAGQLVARVEAQIRQRDAWITAEVEATRSNDLLDQVPLPCTSRLRGARPQREEAAGKRLQREEAAGTRASPPTRLHEPCEARGGDCEMKPALPPPRRRGGERGAKSGAPRAGAAVSTSDRPGSASTAAAGSGGGEQVRPLWRRHPRGGGDCGEMRVALLAGASPRPASRPVRP